MFLLPLVLAYSLKCEHLNARYDPDTIAKLRFLIPTVKEKKQTNKTHFLRISVYCALFHKVSKYYISIWNN